jgi:hypothetical protein
MLTPDLVGQTDTDTVYTRASERHLKNASEGVSEGAGTSDQVLRESLPEEMKLKHPAVGC